MGEAAGSMLQIVCICSVNSSSVKLESSEDMYTLPLQAALILIAVLAADINSECRGGVVVTGGFEGVAEVIVLE